MLNVIFYASNISFCFVLFFRISIPQDVGILQLIVTLLFILRCQKLSEKLLAIFMQSK